jgi:hypothetical protein
MPTSAAPAPLDLDSMPPDATIEASDLAVLLVCSVRHVQRMAASGQIPAPLRIGQLSRWRVGTLREWLRGAGKEGQ